MMMDASVQVKVIQIGLVADLVDMFASPGSEACIVCSGVTIFFQSAPSLPIPGYIFRTPHRLPHSPMLGYDQITPKFTKRQEKYDAKCLYRQNFQVYKGP